MLRRAISCSAAAVLICAAGASGDATLDAIGYTTLKSELGLNTPSGAGIPVAQVEANNGAGYFAATETHPSSGLFTDKTFTFVTASSDSTVAISSHAQKVAQFYIAVDYSPAPGVTNIVEYSVPGWREKILHSNTSLMPSIVPARVANHSYLESIAVIPGFDFMTATDDLINVVAVANDFNGDSMGLPSAFNAISVGRTDGHHITGTTPWTGVYANVRTAPLLVVPQDLTSYAAPYVSGTAASLIQFGHTHPSLSNGSYQSPRSGGTIYNAETSEVIKAALLAGADRSAVGTYTVNTSSGLSNKWGAGQVNMYDSYHILAGGEQNSQQAGRAANISRYGFDYDPSFNQSDEASYTFSSDLTRHGIVASLVWNLKIAGGSSTNFDTSQTLYHFNLQLFDQSNLSTPVAQSNSTTENTQNLYVPALQSRHNYVLKVVPQSGQGNFTWDYGLAWRITPADEILKTNDHGLYTLLAGDDNGDGSVNTLDVNQLVSHFGFTGTIWDDGDFNQDGFIDSLDFNLLASNYGFVGAALPSALSGSGALSASSIGSIVPEPSALLLLASAGAFLRRRSGARPRKN